MRERPSEVTDAQVLEAARTHWDRDLDRVDHLPVGFGAWHWRGSGEGSGTVGGNGGVSGSSGSSSTARGEPQLFLTLDPPLWHDAESLENTYSAAAELAANLDFVHPSLPTSDGRFTVPLGEGRLSCTRWVPGAAPERFGPEAAEAVRRLHSTPPPGGLRVWRSQVDAGLVDELQERTAAPWTQGPLGERARGIVREALGPLEDALRAHQELHRRLDPDQYVTTHGEPGVHNQWRADDGRLLLLDWETLALAPRERDLLGGTHEWVEGDPDLLRFFQLEWSLSEVEGYARWLGGPHAEDADTTTALAGLREETEAASRPG